ncbi:MAG: dioxygenase [Ilumatobacteraceae bacterium]|jgi:hydroxyquinol 1,2-dioxygenase
MNLTPAQHLEQVLTAFASPENPRLRELLASTIRHLYAIVEETNLTHEEWFAAIDFLTKVGKKSDEVRQEFILLSDTLGVSMLLEMINYRASASATEPTVFGPFHVDGSPERHIGESIVDHALGSDEPLKVRGCVLNTKGAPIAGATLDVWQVQSNGLYDVQQSQDTRNLRGIFTTSADGTYEFTTVRPVDYSIPDDGPVGMMLAVAGRHPFRPAHIHFVVSADGHIPVTTHIFDSRSKYLESDAVFGVRKSLVVSMENGLCEKDFVLEVRPAE